MLKLDRKKISISILVAVAFVCIGVITLGMFAHKPEVFAGGAAGGNDSTGGSSSGACDDFTWHGGTGNAQHDCKGAAWMRFSVGTKPAGGKAQYASDQSVITKIDKACAEMGEYYRLGLARFHYVNKKFQEYTGELAYFKRVNQVSPVGGIIYAGNARNALQQVEAEKTFKDAKEYWQAKKDAGEKLSADTEAFLNQSWEETSWFCWNPDKANNSAQSTFGVWSTAEAYVGGSKKLTVNTKTLDSDNSGTLKTKEKQVTVNFKHRFNYVKPTGVTGDFDPAVTKYQVVVNNNGSSSQIVPANTDYTVTDSGPNRTAGPLEPNTVGDSSQTVDVPDAGSVRVCSKISYDPKIIAWKQDAGKWAMDSANSKNEGRSSEVCVTIEKLPDDEEEEEDGGQIRFWSTSGVKSISGDAGDVVQHSLESNEDGTVLLKISSDSKVVNVDFWHRMFYKHEQRDGSAEITDGTPKDEWSDDVCSEFMVESDDNTTPNPASGEYCAVKDSQKQSSGEKVSGETHHAIQLKTGDTVKVCENITYDPKIVTLTRKAKKEKVQVGVKPVVDQFGFPVLDMFGRPTYEPVYQEFFDHWEYSIEDEMDTGGSQSCIEITRPAEDNPGGQGPSSGGNIASDPMYVEETATMKQEVSAIAYKTRRIMEWRAIAFQPKVSVDYSATNVTGNLSSTSRDNIDPCAYYRGKFGGGLRKNRCVEFARSDSIDNIGSTGVPNSQASEESQSGNWGSGEKTLFVPEYVGDKYCNSFGYRWEYWWGAQFDDGPVDWKSDGKSYWTNYDAACRAIAKKPSLSVFNGGIFVGGMQNVVTSLAPRKHYPDFAHEVTDPSYDQAYGSWAEYLAVVSGQVKGKQEKGFGSGASLAWDGSKYVDILKNSPLSISNTTQEVGWSGITANSSTVDRLLSYFGNNCTGFSLGEIRSNETNIICIDGDVLIDRDIKLTQNTGDSIYTLPQVVIIAKNGSININSEVNRVDAWLIAPNGVLNTCDNGDNLLGGNNSIGASVRDYGGDTTCSKRLEINGPVFTKNVISKRSFGADGISNDDHDEDNTDYESGNHRAVSGEVFNLSADTYLWAYAQAGRYSSSYSEAYSRELPPRY